MSHSLKLNVRITEQKVIASEKSEYNDVEKFAVKTIVHSDGFDSNWNFTNVCLI